MGLKGIHSFKAKHCRKRHTSPSKQLELVGCLGEGVMTYEKFFGASHTLSHFVDKWCSAKNHLLDCCRIPSISSWRIGNDSSQLYHHVSSAEPSVISTWFWQLRVYGILFCWIVCHCHILLRCTAKLSVLSAINNFSDPRFSSSGRIMTSVLWRSIMKGNNSWYNEINQ